MPWLLLSVYTCAKVSNAVTNAVPITHAATDGKCHSFLSVTAIGIHTMRCSGTNMSPPSTLSSPLLRLCLWRALSLSLSLSCPRCFCHCSVASITSPSWLIRYVCPCDGRMCKSPNVSYGKLTASPPLLECTLSNCTLFRT